MASIDAMIKWMTDNEGKVAYAMVRPWGNGNPPQYDCSAAVITALRAGGFMDYSGGNYGNTGTLQISIMPKIAKQITRSECKRGDIFLANPTAPNGSNAHTGIFLDNNTIIHSNGGAMTISRTSASGGNMGYTPHYFWRLNGTETPQPDIERNEIGMFIYFQPRATGTVSDMYGVWGNKRFHLNTMDKVGHFKNMVKDTTGRDCKEYRWARGSEQIKTVESFTELQVTVQ